MNTTSMVQWQMTAVDKEFELVKSDLPEISTDEALIEIAGCGVCHTDLSFWHYGVRTKMELPLTLGHEISGKVLAGPPGLIGKNVIVPAVLPCGECDICKSGRSNICQNQLMPGNDFHGGFASHIKVPHKYLCPVPDKVLEKYSLAQLAVVADAISTPYQVVEKSELVQGDLAVIIGVGGVGIYGALIAKIKGAKVLAIDINDEKLTKVKGFGIDATLNSNGLDFKAIKSKVREVAKELGTSKFGWKIFDFSGTKPGQELGFGLVTFASTLSIVGFTMDKIEARLSNLMAFDAKIIGTWGCKPELYPEVIELIQNDQLIIDQFVETMPLSNINQVFKDTLAHKFDKRTVLIPDLNNNN
jgi:6-hydroxycyclohex-1-ene-1-carbonyl-CoA dehydrogenase